VKAPWRWLMLARCGSASLRGIGSREVTVEVDIAPGCRGFGLGWGWPITPGRECRERVRAALRNSGFRAP